MSDEGYEQTMKREIKYTMKAYMEYVKRVHEMSEDAREYERRLWSN
jgi:hypothetical protein